MSIQCIKFLLSYPPLVLFWKSNYRIEGLLIENWANVSTPVTAPWRDELGADVIRYVVMCVVWWCIYRFCPRCRLHCRATKEMSLWRLPQILVIHLKRFSFANLLLRDKIEDLVEFPLRWGLPSIMSFELMLPSKDLLLVAYLEYFCTLV